MRRLGADDRRNRVVADLDSITTEAYAALTQLEPARAHDAPPHR